VCTGHSWKPNVPLINGIEKFHGQVIHSSQYKV
jgi:cation diffusion facilitator CzcD-associated flavoprotein CzcO